MLYNEQIQRIICHQNTFGLTGTELAGLMAVEENYYFAIIYHYLSHGFYLENLYIPLQIFGQMIFDLT